MRIIRYLLMAIVLAMATHSSYAQQFTAASKISTSGTYTIAESKYDNSGNLIVAGYFTGSLTIGGKSITSAGKQDIFIACFNTSMTCYQLLQYGGTSDETVSALTTDAINNIYIAGSATNGFKLGTYSYSSTFPGGYVAKLNSSGTMQFVKDYVTNGVDIYANVSCGSSPTCGMSVSNAYVYLNDLALADISVDDVGNIYISGTYKGSLTETGSGAYTTASNTATCNTPSGCGTRTRTYTAYYYLNNTAFAAKLNNTGTKVWTKKYGAGLSDNTSGNTITASSKATYFSYYDNRTSGTPKTEILRLNNANGNTLWNKSFTSTYITDGAINSKSNFIFTGYYVGRSGAFYIFNSGSSFSGRSSFLHQFDSSGNTLNAMPLHSGNAGTNNVLYIDAKDNIYLSGTTYDQIYTTKRLPSTGGLNQFVLRLNPTFKPTLQTITSGVSGTSVSPLAISLINKKINLFDRVAGSVSFDTVSVNAGTGTLYNVQLDTTFYQQPTPAKDSLVSGEYFFNTDPGLGKGVQFNFTDNADSIYVKLKASISTLSAGFNSLFVRIKTKTGLWSMYEGRVFYIQPKVLRPTAGDTLVKAEYFIDTDPGLGKGTAITFSAARDSVALAGKAKISTLSEGFHNLFVRVQNKAGLWSMYEGRVFYVQPKVTRPYAGDTLVKAEYFIDTDPGLGKGTAITFSAAKDSVEITGKAKISTLSEGFHNLFVRVQNKAGLWSMYEGRVFYIQGKSVQKTAAKIVDAEYFFNTDPGIGNGTKVSPSFTAAEVIDITRLASIAGLPAGKNMLYVRVKDSTGKWSLTEGKSFVICSTVLDKPVITGKLNYCPGDTIRLNGGTVTGAVSYLWKGPNNFTSTQQNITINNITAAKAGHYTFVAVRSGGTACDTSTPASVTVILNAPGSPQSLKLTGNAGFCAGDSVILSTNAVNGYKYRWLLNGSNTANAGDTLSSLVVKNAGKYNVRVTNTSGCSYLMRDTVISIFTKPVLSSITGTTNVLTASTQTYSVTQTAGSAYAWFVENGLVNSGNGTNNISVQWQNQPGTGNIKVIETNAKGCVSDTQRLNITIDSISISVSPTSLNYVAMGGTKQVTVTSNTSWTAVTNAPTWVTIATASGTGNKNVNISVSANPNGNSRSATVTFTAGSVTSVVNITQDSAYFTVSPKSLNYVAAGETKQVTVTSNINWNASSNQSWITVNPGSGNGNATPNITLSANTTQSTRSGTVTFTAGTFTEVVNITQDFTSGMAEVEAITGLKIFPNPSTGLFTIENNFDKMANVKVYDATGRIVSTFKMLPTVTTELDYKHFSPGVYMLNIVTDNRIITQRLVITK